MRGYLHIACISLILLGSQTSLHTSLFPRLNLSPRALTLSLQFVVACAQLSNSLLSQQLLQCPLLNVLCLVLLELSDKLNCSLQDRALILFASWNNLCEFVDTFVDGFTTTTLNCGGLAIYQEIADNLIIPSLWLSFRTLCHSSDPTAGLLDGLEGVAFCRKLSSPCWLLSIKES
jgi:hypothetical protein